jgi:hypothetical protein
VLYSITNTVYVMISMVCKLKGQCYEMVL